ncbi:MAG: hypothetical protein KJI72_01535 [Patescibacteria group bacterium]|nr:hypothetical protein [Patescibacteria group bacterium]
MRKKAITLLVTFVLLITGTLIYRTNQLPAQLVRDGGNTPQTISGKEHIIELREGGLSPEEITVQKGDTIIFANASDEPFWPASDPHPTHQFLSGFDQGHAIDSGSSWNYTFYEPGIWYYHDHLNLTLKGKITVVDSSNLEKPTGELDCEYGSENEKARCFDERIKTAVKVEGVGAAFKLFAKLYESGSAPESCHWTGHLIGEEAYHEYKQGKDVPVTSEANYCGYAFYHGFLETLLRDNPDIEWARSFCKYVLEKVGPDAQDNCFHGIGHGFTEDPPDPRLHGNARGYLKPGLEVCEYLYGDTENKWEICATGVYTVLAGFMWDGKYEFSLDPKDPFAFCRAQPERYHIACYGEFAPRLDSATNWDVSKLPQHIKNIDNPDLRKFVVRVAAGVMMQRDIAKYDLTNYIQGCRTLKGNLPLACLGGVSWGLVMSSEPGREHVYALRFCGSGTLNEEERGTCYREALLQLKRSLTPEKLKPVCESVDEKYRTYCIKNP